METAVELDLPISFHIGSGDMAEGLLIIEADGRIQFTNPACDKYLGYQENELAGRAIAFY